MATTEDELAKKQVQEAVWTWAGRAIVVAVVFGFGFFAAWLMWGVGERGAPALRVAKENLDAQLLAQAVAYSTGEEPRFDPLPDDLELQAHAVAAARARTRGGKL